jgi:hypothetical protein
VPAGSAASVSGTFDIIVPLATVIYQATDAVAHSGAGRVLPRSPASPLTGHLARGGAAAHVAPWQLE